MSQILINDFISELKAENQKLSADLVKCQKFNELLLKYRIHFKDYLKVCKCKQTSDKALIDIQIQSLDQQLMTFEDLIEVKTYDNQVVDTKNELFGDSNAANKTSIQTTHKELIPNNHFIGVTMNECSESVDNNHPKRFDCELLGCDKTFVSKNSLCLHMNRYHKNGKKYFQCLKCVECFPKRTELISHQLIHMNGEKRFDHSRDSDKNIGDIERSLYTNSVDLRQEESEIVVITPDVLPKTIIHTVVPNTTLGLSPSMSSEIISKREDNYMSEDSYDTDCRLKRCEDNKWKKFVCTWHDCQHRSRNNQDLLLHIRRKHTFEKPFRCDECGKSFHLEKVLTQHRRIHSDHKFECDFEGCSYKTPYKWDFREHTYVKHLSKIRFECGINGCNKSYKYERDLKIHQNRTHNNDTECKTFHYDWTQG